VSHRRLKALAPIRDYIRRTYPPSTVFTQPLLNHFRALLSVWTTYQELPNVFPQLISHLGNITSIFSNALTSEGLARPDIGHGILTLNRLSMIMLKGHSPLFQYLPSIIESSSDENLKWTYTLNCVRATADVHSRTKNAEDLVNQGIQYFAQHKDYASQGII
jgi:hypothetical protein